ncbi:MAG: hypothetical protein EOO47_13005 [Flavobacterium sp.]|nr:MAG: hypothetical protein EOO47_13005 [Flavobacterium sp.]
MGNIVSSLFTAGITSAALGLFYTVLLNAHGFTNVKYKYVVLIFFCCLLGLGFISFEALGITCFVLGIGIFILAIALFARGMGDSLKSMSKKSSSVTSPEAKDKTLYDASIANYVGVVFHFVVVVLICVSIFTYSDDVILDQTRMERLIGDAFFQFYSTLMLMLLGLFNPFVTPSEKLMGLADKLDPEGNSKLYKLLSNKQNWVTIKAIICVLIIAYFVNDGLFGFPSWDSSNLFMNGYLILIGFYILVNLNQLIRNPDFFFRRNVFRLTLLFKSAWLSIFVGAILVFSTMFLSSVIGVDIDRLKVSSESILFLGFNLLMLYNEYRLAKV